MSRYKLKIKSRTWSSERSKFKWSLLRHLRNPLRWLSREIISRGNNCWALLSSIFHPFNSTQRNSAKLLDEFFNCVLFNSLEKFFFSPSFHSHSALHPRLLPKDRRCIKMQFLEWMKLKANPFNCEVEKHQDQAAGKVSSWVLNNFLLAVVLYACERFNRKRFVHSPLSF